MIIDCHTHIGPVMEIDDRVWLTADGLVDWMNRQGIDKAVLLPLENPEACYGPFGTREALAEARRFAERIMVFASVDPRRPSAVKLLETAKLHGCVGFGEHKVGLAIDDPLSVELYRAAGELGFAVLIHLDHLIVPTLNYDEVGLPRLEKLLKMLPKTNFIMHGPGWWAEIAPKPATGVAYPPGPVAPGGAIDRLFSNYPNIFGDLSAGSGFNGLTRDPDFAAGFIERHWRRLLFGTDYLRPGQHCPIIEHLRKLDIPAEWKDAIYAKNLLALLPAQ